MKVSTTENVNCCFHNYQKAAELKMKNTIRLKKGRSFFRILEDWRQDKVASERDGGWEMWPWGQRKQNAIETDDDRVEVVSSVNSTGCRAPSSYIPIKGRPCFNLSNKKVKSSPYAPACWPLAGSLPAEGAGFFGRKILSMPSFGREVKPFVPCRKFCTYVGLVGVFRI
jgi:hypothetical protein